jgi:hypothetical protein
MSQFLQRWTTYGLQIFWTCGSDIQMDTSWKSPTCLNLCIQLRNIFVRLDQFVQPCPHFPFKWCEIVIYKRWKLQCIRIIFLPAKWLIRGQIQWARSIHVKLIEEWNKLKWMRYSQEMFNKLQLHWCITHLTCDHSVSLDFTLKTLLRPKPCTMVSTPPSISDYAVWKPVWIWIPKQKNTTKWGTY